MRSDRSGQRLPCPRCGANNFVGQAQCWQCHASLPPPEALNGTVMNAPAQPMPAPRYPAAPPAVMPPSAAMPTVPAWTAGSPPSNPIGQSRRSLTPLLIGVVLLTFSVIVLFSLRHSASSPTSASPFPAAAGLNGQNSEMYRDARGVVPERDMPNSGLPDAGSPRLAMPAREALPPSSDPNEAAARQLIQRAAPNLGLPSGAGADGTVHLRNGDTISQEQYEDAKRKLQHNPLLGGQPPVPRL